MIGYKEKTNILFRAKINDKFTFYNQKDNFSTFYDSNSINWLVKFESKDQNEFTKTLESYNVSIVNSSDTLPANSEKTDNLILQKPELPQKPLLLNSDKEDVVSDGSESKQRANILNRMAKMGQAILPRNDNRNTSTELSDSDFEEKSLEKRIPHRHFKKTSSEKPKQLNTESTEIHSIVNKYPLQQLSNEVQHLQPNQISNQQLLSNQVVFNPQLPNQLCSPQIYQPPWVNDGYNQYIISQNTELKMTLAQISSKLDNVLHIKKTVEVEEDIDKTTYLSKLKAMQLKSENLETVLQNYEKQYGLLKAQYDELGKTLQNSNGIDSRNKELKILENTVLELKQKLQEVEKKYQSEQSEVEIFQNKTKELEYIIESQREQLQNYKKLDEDRNTVEELNESIKNLNDTIDIQKSKLNDFVEYFNKTEAEKKMSAEINNNKIRSFDDIIKKHMNSMYQSVLDNFEEDNSYTFAEIQMSIAKNLKTTSFKIIEDCVHMLKEKNTLEE